jgi:hypothetical protein
MQMDPTIEYRPLLDDDLPPVQLRAVNVIPNRSAHQERFTIPTNMRMPSGSVMHHLCDGELQIERHGHEDLGQWESPGRSLDARALVVVGRIASDRVIALVQPTEESRVTKQRCRRALFLGQPKTTKKRQNHD